MATATVGRYDAVLDLIEKLNMRKAELEGIIERSYAEEHEARRASLEADPSKRSDANGARGDVGKVIRRRSEAEDALPGVEAELRAAGEVFAGLKSSLNDEQLARVAEEVAELDEQEAEHVGRLVDAMETMMIEWGSISAFWASRAEATFLDGQHVSENGVNVKIQEGRSPLLAPQPVDFLAMVECLYEQCCDPRNIGIREGNPASIGSSTFNKAWAQVTRDLRSLDTYAAIPPNSAPRYSSAANTRAHHGEGRAVYPEFRDANGNLPAPSRIGFGG